MDDDLFRIGELSRRSGVSPELLRAWEQRYGLLEPSRSPGGLRLYSRTDLARVELMKERIESGLAAAEAAAAVRRSPREPERQHTALALDAARAELRAALDRFDGPAAQAVLDRLLAAATIDTVLCGVLLPYLHELGERWQRDEASVAQEHFASSILGGRLIGLARGWDAGAGLAALLACLPGERHELGLIAFGLALRARGWRITYLGGDTPVATLADAASALRPDLVAVTAVSENLLDASGDTLETLGDELLVAVGGPAAHSSRLEGGRVLALTGDPVAEAERVTNRLMQPA